MQNTAVVVPNWNGMDSLKVCLDSLLAQTEKHALIVVENGSSDGSLEFLRNNYPSVQLVINKTNLGFAGGVNSGIRVAIDQGCDYVALFNNDAVADTEWLKWLVDTLKHNHSVGVATCKLMSTDKTHLDSTGDLYTNWGLPYPRGRGEHVSDVYDKDQDVFGASGGASIYRVSMLAKINLFDEDFFAYYEDVDISFRAQLAGWKVRYVPESIAYHQIGATSRKIKGFTTYQTMKNQPLVLYKNLPRRYWWTVGWRFMFAHTLFFLRATSRGQGWIALKGSLKGMYLVSRKSGERKQIQSLKTVSDEYIWSIMTHDLPPNANALRKLRSYWWLITKRSA